MKPTDMCTVTVHSVYGMVSKCYNASQACLLPEVLCGTSLMTSLQINSGFFQARRQAEAISIIIGLDARDPDFDACEQQRRRPACASAQSDQHLFYSLSEK